jgi:hemerythrin
MKEKNASGRNDTEMSLAGKASALMSKLGDKITGDKAIGEDDPFAFLMSHHREVESLFAELERVGSGSVRPRREIFLELARKLEAHAQVEEKVLYPAGRVYDQKTTLEAYEEHKLCRVVIEDLAAVGRGDDASFEANLEVLKELVENHVQEEEQEYFKTLRSEMDDEEMRLLGQRLLREYGRIESEVAKMPFGRVAVRRSSVAVSRSGRVSSVAPKTKSPNATKPKSRASAIKAKGPSAIKAKGPSAIKAKRASAIKAKGPVEAKPKSRKAAATKSTSKGTPRATSKSKVVAGGRAPLRQVAARGGRNSRGANAPA